MTKAERARISEEAKRIYKNSWIELHNAVKKEYWAGAHVAYCADEYRGKVSGIGTAIRTILGAAGFSTKEIENIMFEAESEADEE